MTVDAAATKSGSRNMKYEQQNMSGYDFRIQNKIVNKTVSLQLNVNQSDFVGSDGSHDLFRLIITITITITIKLLDHYQITVNHNQLELQQVVQLSHTATFPLMIVHRCLWSLSFVFTLASISL